MTEAKVTAIPTVLEKLSTAQVSISGCFTITSSLLKNLVSLSELLFLRRAHLLKRYCPHSWKKRSYYTLSFRKRIECYFSPFSLYFQSFSENGSASFTSMTAIKIESYVCGQLVDS